MPIFLRHRAQELSETMDQPDCDRDKLFRTYKQFKVINQLTSQWRRIYCQYLRPEMRKEERSFDLLDIGCGGGDISFALMKWASYDKLDLKITAIDNDPRALSFLNQINKHNGIQFMCKSLDDLFQSEQKFDFIISNHLVHHLSAKDFYEMMKKSESMALSKVIFNDIERSDIAWLGFGCLASLLFFRSYIVSDGLRSIRRSYSKLEAEKTVRDKWIIKRYFPYRLLFTYEKNA
jgi:2-polyprenyl-3-methyl-5-hydroxy-6-metoxy-1,4-benzoquinol methylase